VTLPEGTYSKEELDTFKKLFDQWYTPVVNFLYYRCGDIHLSEDIVQEVFLKLWSMRDELRSDTVKALIYRIAGNLLMNHYKHQQVTLRFASTRGEDTGTEPADAGLEQEEFKQELERVISSIPVKSREVFLMNRIDDLTYQEIADRLELSVKAVEKRMHEALAIIREKIKHKI
jgi:RNA polymerase sigma-70 factor (family 1)